MPQHSVPASVPPPVAERTEVIAELECVVEYIYFIRDDGFSVLSAVPTRGAEPGSAGFAAAGVELAGVRPGETLRLTGHWEETRRHGPRLAVGTCARLRPDSVRAIRRYLASGLVRGIGPLLAQALTDRFGEQTLEVIDREPERLAEVYGIGRRRGRWIVESWHAQAEIRELMAALRGYGISPLLAERLHRDYGSSALETLTHYPYRLVGEADGVSFAAADRIAIAEGQALNGEERLEAAVWEVCAGEGPSSPPNCCARPWTGSAAARPRRSSSSRIRAPASRSPRCASPTALSASSPRTSPCSPPPPPTCRAGYAGWLRTARTARTWRRVSARRSRWR